MVQLIPIRRNDADKDATHPTRAPMRLVVRIVEYNRLVATSIKPRLIIGRGGSTREPDIDLAPFGGIDGGVSRWHAAIHYDDTEGVLYIEDMNSTNGTRLNGFQIEPGRRYRLRNGDEIELGRVCINTALVRVPS